MIQHMSITPHYNKTLTEQDTRVKIRTQQVQLTDNISIPDAIEI